MYKTRKVGLRWFLRNPKTHYKIKRLLYNQPQLPSRLEILMQPVEHGQGNETVEEVQKGIVQKRLPAILGGIAAGMASVPAAVGAAVVAGGSLICLSGGGGGCGSGPCDIPSFKPTTWGAFVGAFSGAVVYGVKLGHDAYKAAGNLLDKSALVPIFKGWGIGGLAGGVAVVGGVATVELTQHALKARQHRAEAYRNQHNLEGGLRVPRGTYNVGAPSQSSQPQTPWGR
jgi:hypothetical protein